jgi:hypothetical protein
MTFKTRAALVWVLTLLLTLSSFSVAVAANIDNSLVGLAFEKFDELDPDTKTEAINLLKSYCQSNSTLNSLKQDLPAILKIVVGDDYKSKLEQKNISLAKLNSEIDKIKDWSYDDRMAVFDMVEDNDRDGVKDLLKKYEDDKTSPGTGGGPSTKESEQPQEPQQTEQTDQFTDIQNYWAKSYIEFIGAKGIIKGKAQGIFAPEDNVTRAEFTAMLTRLLELNDKSTATLPFIDVAEKDWFYEIVNTAFASGLIQGKGDLFDPNGLITREEMVVLITRAASAKDKSIPVDSFEVEQLLLPFKDKEEISHWARTETAIALKLGLIQGTGPDRFEPKTHATRAQAATVMYNLCGIFQPENHLTVK